ncbi:hypothetical protein ACFE04_014666 [Oxalis oulophora]
MGKKKSKSPESQNGIASPPPPPPQSSACSSLFGGVSAQNDTVLSSLFSDNNPFKRKDKIDEQLEAAEVKKRKMNKESKEKSKLDKGKMGIEEKDELGSNKNVNFDVGINNNNNNNNNNNLRKKKRKRKRDDVEKEYESRMIANEEGEGISSNVVLVGKKRKKADDSADTMVCSKEGFDDESKLLRTVFVGNLPVKVKKKVLIKEFSKFGEIESVRIRSVPLMDTKKPVKGAIMLKQINEGADSVHAYIVFKTEESAQSSLSHNMTVVGGNHIRVDRACPPRKKLKGDSSSLYDNKRTVFVGNLPFDVKDEELYQLFFGIAGLESSIEAIRVIRQPRVGVGKGIAYVLFKTKEAANLATRKRLKLRDRDLRVSQAKESATPSKRKAPQNDEGKYTSPSKKTTRDWTPASYDSTPKTASISYQGLRGNKSKNNAQRNLRPTSNYNAQKNEGTTKVQLTKRPSVTARRGEAQNEASGSKYAGAKRKMGSRTPESSHRHKKVKKFR